MKSYEDRQLFHIHVESETNEAKVETPRRFRLDGRTIEIAENIDRWYGPRYRYLRLS